MTQFNTAAQTEIDRYGNSKELKRKKLEELREYHGLLIQDLGISPLDFNMKMPFYDSQGRYVVGIFPSEFRKDKGFFFELIGRDLLPVYQDRRIYRVPPNETFEQEYELNDKGSYLVPLEELRMVNQQSVAISKASAVTSNDSLFKQMGNPVRTEPPQPTIQAYRAPAAMEDAPYQEMTIRDFMAIHTGRPVSAKSWLNELIKQANK